MRRSINRSSNGAFRRFDRFQRSVAMRSFLLAPCIASIACRTMPSSRLAIDARSARSIFTSPVPWSVLWLFQSGRFRELLPRRHVSESLSEQRAASSYSVHRELCDRWRFACNERASHTTLISMSACEGKRTAASVPSGFVVYGNPGGQGSGNSGGSAELEIVCIEVTVPRSGVALAAPAGGGIGVPRQQTKRCASLAGSRRAARARCAAAGGVAAEGAAARSRDARGTACGRGPVARRTGTSFEAGSLGLSSVACLDLAARAGLTHQPGTIRYAERRRAFCNDRRGQCQPGPLLRKRMEGEDTAGDAGRAGQPALREWRSRSRSSPRTSSTRFRGRTASARRETAGSTIPAGRSSSGLPAFPVLAPGSSVRGRWRLPPGPPVPAVLAGSPV